MGLAPSSDRENPGKPMVAKVPVPICSQPLRDRSSRTKKADMVERPEVFHHVGLLVNEPSGITGLPFS
jgi:hypothetical protein